MIFHPEISRCFFPKRPFPGVTVTDSRWQVENVCVQVTSWRRFPGAPLYAFCWQDSKWWSHFLSPTTVQAMFGVSTRYLQPDLASTLTIELVIDLCNSRKGYDSLNFPWFSLELVTFLDWKVWNVQTSRSSNSQESKAKRLRANDHGQRLLW